MMALHDAPFIALDLPAPSAGLTAQEDYALRGAFEDWTLEYYGWTNFLRDADGYRCREIQNGWVLCRLGFLAGKMGAL